MVTVTVEGEHVEGDEDLEELLEAAAPKQPAASDTEAEAAADDAKQEKPAEESDNN